MRDSIVRVRLRQQHDYLFSIDFGAGVPLLLADEPAPLGAGAGPSPMQLLASSVGNCLSASLLFALRKFKQHPEPIGCEVDAEVGRNTEGRLRVLKIDVRLTLGVPAAALDVVELHRLHILRMNLCDIFDAFTDKEDAAARQQDKDFVCLVVPLHLAKPVRQEFVNRAQDCHSPRAIVNQRRVTYAIVLADFKQRCWNSHGVLLWTRSAIQVFTLSPNRR